MNWIDSGIYKVTPASRFDLSNELQMKIHDEAVAALKDGKSEKDNPYPFECPAFLQWEHSFDEYREATENSY